MANETVEKCEHCSCSVGMSLGLVQNADKDTQKLLDEVKDKVIENSDGHDYSNLEAVFYKHKVTGKAQLYYIHAKTKDGKYVFVKVLKHSEADGGKAEYQGVKHDREQFEEINEF